MVIVAEGSGGTFSKGGHHFGHEVLPIVVFALLLAGTKLGSGAALGQEPQHPGEASTAVAQVNKTAKDPREGNADAKNGGTLVLLGFLVGAVSAAAGAFGAWFSSISRTHGAIRDRALSVTESVFEGFAMSREPPTPSQQVIVAGALIAYYIHVIRFAEGKQRNMATLPKDIVDILDKSYKLVDLKLKSSRGNSLGAAQQGITPKVSDQPTPAADG